MDNLENSLKLYQYHIWANKEIFNHLKDIPGAYTQEVQSVFSSISDVIYHMYQVDYIWLRVMKKDSFENIMASLSQLKEGFLGKGLNEMGELYQNLSEEYKIFIGNQENINMNISVYHPRYGTLHTTYAELIQHVVNHGTYHRGNITAILRQLGYTGKPTDYVFYLFQQNKA
ncbi:protein DinB [Heyndrickxia sporothermodurans]|nr:protein DinB [Heyndrickxia sporothermodurans]